MHSDRKSDNCFWTMGVDAAASKDARTSLDWTREEDKTFEIALTTHYNDADMWGKIALAVPGKTVQDLKLHYEEVRASATRRGSLDRRGTQAPCQNAASSTAGTEELLPERASCTAVHSGTQQLSGCATVTSGNALWKRGRLKNASSTDENKLMQHGKILTYLLMVNMISVLHRYQGKRDLDLSC